MYLTPKNGLHPAFMIRDNIHRWRHNISLNVGNIIQPWPIVVFPGTALLFMSIDMVLRGIWLAIYQLKKYPEIITGVQIEYKYYQLSAYILNTLNANVFSSITLSRIVHYLLKDPMKSKIFFKSIRSQCGEWTRYMQWRSTHAISFRFKCHFWFRKVCFDKNSQLARLRYVEKRTCGHSTGPEFLSLHIIIFFDNKPVPWLKIYTTNSD